jgi:hypothetical protein
MNAAVTATAAAWNSNGSWGAAVAAEAAMNAAVAAASHGNQSWPQGSSTWSWAGYFQTSVRPGNKMSLFSGSSSPAVIGLHTTEIPLYIIIAVRIIGCMNAMLFYDILIYCKVKADETVAWLLIEDLSKVIVAWIHGLQASTE